MDAIIYPGNVGGSVDLPTSKSLAHRAIICAFLASGKSTIKNVTLSNDIIDTINCVSKLGSKVEVIHHDKIHDIIIDNTNKNILNCKLTIKESASTLRFLIPYLLYTKRKYVIRCNPSLLKRPLSIYQDIFGCEALKITKRKIIIKGLLEAKTYNIEGNVSSQFISGLLFALPFLENDSTINIMNIESKSYIDLTISVLKVFGIIIEDIKPNNKDISRTLKIKGKQAYTSCEYTIEKDYSHAGNFAILGLINNMLTIEPISSNSLQGDYHFLKQMNYVHVCEDYIRIEKDKEKKEHVFDVHDNPDLAPILAIYLCVTGGKLINTERLKYKESNRLEDLGKELTKLGVSTVVNSNEMIITKKEYFIGNVTLKSHNDHRIFMALAILSTIAKKQIKIKNCECLNKSYPDFLDDLGNLGIRIELRRR